MQTMQSSIVHIVVHVSLDVIQNRESKSVLSVKLRNWLIQNKCTICCSRLSQTLSIVVDRLSVNWLAVVRYFSGHANLSVNPYDCFLWIRLIG
jgi:cbb3-type cytochrome oxidase cytochrome c subunit